MSSVVGGPIDSLSDENDEERPQKLGEWLSKVVSKQESSTSEARALDPMLPPSRSQQRLMFFAHLRRIRWVERREGRKVEKEEWVRVGRRTGEEETWRWRTSSSFSPGKQSRGDFMTSLSVSFV